MDPGLVIKAQHGDQDAFGQLATFAHPRLYRAALGVLGDHAAAADATQQALINVWRSLPSLRDADRFDGWSYRLLVRACYAEAKRRPRWLPDSAISERDTPAVVDEASGVVDRDELERGFRRLSVEHRTVIVLRFMLDLPLAEMADVLGVSAGTVSSRLNRALASLRSVLEADARAVVPSRVPGSVS